MCMPASYLPTNYYILEKYCQNIKNNIYYKIYIVLQNYLKFHTCVKCTTTITNLHPIYDLKHHIHNL